MRHELVTGGDDRRLADRRLPGQVHVVQVDLAVVGDDLTRPVEQERRVVDPALVELENRAAQHPHAELAGRCARGDRSPGPARAPRAPCAGPRGRGIRSTRATRRGRRRPQPPRAAAPPPPRCWPRRRHRSASDRRPRACRRCYPGRLRRCPSAATPCSPTTGRPSGPRSSAAPPGPWDGGTSARSRTERREIVDVAVDARLAHRAGPDRHRRSRHPAGASRRQADRLPRPARDRDPLRSRGPPRLLHAGHERDHGPATWGPRRRSTWSTWSRSR